MPIKSAKQKRLMQAVEHNPAFAKKVGISHEVAHEMLHPKSKKKNPANRMDIALFKGADGDMAISENALSKVLKHTAAMGREGDTELVHVNKAEEAMLKAHGGRGSVNPKTGLKEYPPTGADRSSVGMGVSGRDSSGAQTGRGSVGKQGSSGEKGSGGAMRNNIAGAENAIRAAATKGLDADIAAGKYKSSGVGTTAGAAIGMVSPLGPIGGLIGGWIGGMVDDAINGPPTPQEAGQKALEDRGFRQPRDSSFGGGSGRVGNQGGGREGPMVPYAKGQQTNPQIPNNGTPPVTGTTTGNETKDYVDLLLERFKFPYFEMPVSKTINRQPHEDLINSVIGDRR